LIQLLSGINLVFDGQQYPGFNQNIHAATIVQDAVSRSLAAHRSVMGLFGVRDQTKLVEH
jgi:hypothetical protein